MPADQPGPPAPTPKGSSRGGGPKRPPRPERPPTPDTRTAARNGDATDPQAPPPGFASVAPRGATATVTVPPRPPESAPAPAPATAEVPVAAASAAPPATQTAGGRRRRRGRRVKRVVRRIDLWSVLKLSLVVYTCLYIAVLATLAALWGIAYSSGSVDKLQSFLEDVGLENFTFYGDDMFRACAAIGAVGVLAGTVITVLATALVNVISEMTGGIRLVVIEEEPER